MEFLKNVWTIFTSWFFGLGFVVAIRDKISPWYGNIAISKVVNVNYAILIAFALAIIIVISIISAIVKSAKKQKITLYSCGKKCGSLKVKRKKEVELPAPPEKSGFTFSGWYKDKNFTKPFEGMLVKKKGINLYAKYDEEIKEEAPEAPLSEVKPEEKTGVAEIGVYETNYAEKTGVVEEIIENLPEENSIGSFYDGIRYELLGYERAASFKKLGVERKQVIAEMFERDDVINLYLSADPSLLKMRGYSVEAYREPEFAIVPCKKTIKNNEDYQEALRIIKDVMLLNNLIKSENTYAKKVSSDEKTRKNGFAFYVKNDVVATSAADYYRLLRAIVLSYTLSPNRKFPQSLDNKMILKIFKKEERVFLYLALNADKEGLEFVGYDKNFADTPAMFELKTAADCYKANELIDKLMYTFGMEKNPEQAEISLDDPLENSCGFGYRIRH